MPVSYTHLDVYKRQENIIDLEGNKYIDCIGGFGTYIGGHRNPEVVKYVKSQLDRLTLSSTELLEPLRGYLCKTIAMITPCLLYTSTGR